MNLFSSVSGQIFLSSSSRRLALPLLLALAGAMSLAAEGPVTREVWLDELGMARFTEGIRPVQTNANYRGEPQRIAGVQHARGVGVQSVSVLPFLLRGQGVRFTAVVGADDGGNPEIPVTFQVVADRRVVFDSGEMRIGDPGKAVDLDLTGVQQLGLLVTDKIGGLRNKRTYANWSDARLIMRGDHRPEPPVSAGERYILTPPAPPQPRINSPRIFGVRPGHPLLFTLAATGEQPLRFSATGLPPGVTLDAETGILTGSIATRGEYPVQLAAENARGRATQGLTIKVGDAIALTPPMGWNGWNAWAHRIDREKVLASAHAMVATGLSRYGWIYINIDDAWQGRREGPLTALQPNEKFPRFKEMVDQIHALGLKVGLYSTPYITSYACYLGASSDRPQGGETREEVPGATYHRIGKHRFENEDARQMAEWGIDFLKYDWRIDVVSAERMSAALLRSGRDIVFSLSNNAPLEKAADWQRVAQLYRTGPDIRDSWTSVFLTSFALDAWAPFIGPGHWGDPDMMVLGNVTIGQEMHPSRLTPDEQYSHVTMNCLLPAPLLIGCPLEQLDAFTLGLLTNSEVIAVNQDPLGRPARRLGEVDGVQIWAKPLEDGSTAIGLFNTAGFGSHPASYFNWGDEKPKTFAFHPRDFGLPGRGAIRDLWRQQDLGEYDDVFTAAIPHHGVILIRLSPRS